MMSDPNTSQIIETVRDRPVFICGHPKSGTSLLRSLLDSHPQLVVFPEETAFFRQFLPRLQNYPGLQTARPEIAELVEQKILHIFTWNSANPVASQADFPGRDYSHISYKEVCQEMRALVEARCDHPGDLLSAAVLAYGQVSGQLGRETQGWVEKSPYNEYYLDQIFDWWPEARCIHILRDPRDNFVSYRRKHPRWAPEFFAANWKRSTQAAIRGQERFGAHRFHIQRYETLTGSPQSSMRDLAQFLGIAWDDSLLAPRRAGQAWKGNSMFAQQFESISAAPVARWKEHLSPQDAAVIEKICQPLLVQFDYPLAATSAELRQATWRTLTWPLRRRFFAR